METRLTLISICLMLLSHSTSAVTLEEIRATPDLTPSKFASLFSEFKYHFRAEVQSPEAFLATATGDCDDYATLAALVLREKGYTPRLIIVRFSGAVHVVCYIEETGTYLDYNNRGVLLKTVKSGSALTEIARKVAKSYRRDWTSVSEFTFSDSTKRMVETVYPDKGGNRRNRL